MWNFASAYLACWHIVSISLSYSLVFDECEWLEINGRWGKVNSGDDYYDPELHLSRNAVTYEGIKGAEKLQTLFAMKQRALKINSSPFQTWQKLILTI